MKIKKINFKQPKYVFPLIGLPFILFLGYQFTSFSSVAGEKEPIKQQELSISLGEVKDSILSKNDAYDEIFSHTDDSRTMLGGLDKEEDSLVFYSDYYSKRQKQIIDSLQEIQKEAIINHPLAEQEDVPNTYSDNNYREQEILRLLQENNQQSTYYESEEKEEDPVQTLRRQMLMLDSLEQSKNPQYQSKLAADQILQRNQEKYNAFLNTTLRLRKDRLSNNFNTLTKDPTDNTIKAIIDEDIKGYLGSRIRLRLLEDTYAEKYKIPKGTFIYAQISGFREQRVNLSIVSIKLKGDIIPVHLTVYDIDGIQGLYVPNSNFREMMREMGMTTVQGQPMIMTDQSFSASLLSNVFQSTSNSIASLIRKNKAKLKYNSHLLLINEKDLQNEEF